MMGMDTDTPKYSRIDLGAAAFKLILSALVGVCAFQIKRLIDEQDKLREIVWQLRQDVVVMRTMMDAGRKRGME